MPTYKGKTTREAMDGHSPLWYSGVMGNKYQELGVSKKLLMLDQISTDPYLRTDRFFTTNKGEIMKAIFEELSDELILKLQMENWSADAIDRLYREDDKGEFSRIVQQVFDDTYTSLTLPYFQGSAQTVRDYQSRNIGALAMMLGKDQNKERLSYWSWPMREKLVRRDENLAPYIYFTGKPGKGKSNAIDLQVLQAIEINYWSYTNRPILPRQGMQDRLYRVGQLTDLFIDTPDIPNIFRAYMWGQEFGIKTGVEIALDERGMGERSASTEGMLKKELMQIRRHFKMSITEGGVRQLQPSLEEDVTLLIACQMQELAETDKNGRPKRKFSWEVIFRPGEEEEDESGDVVRRYVVYNIPKCNLPRMDENEFDLTPDFNIDISMKKLLRFIGDPAKQTVKTLLERTTQYARMQRGMLRPSTEFIDIEEGDEDEPIDDDSPKDNTKDENPSEED